MFDIERHSSLKLIAPREFLQHRGVVLRIIAGNMTDLYLRSQVSETMKRNWSTHLVNNLKVVDDLV